MPMTTTASASNRTNDAAREVAASGYCQVHLGRASDDDLVAFARAFGRIGLEPRDPRPVRPVSPSSENEARKNTLSSRYGFGPFPFHTDTAYWREPASFLLLYCVNPGRADRATLVSDSRRWNHPDRIADLMASSVWKVQRNRDAFLTRLAVRTAAGLAFRYDPHCMCPVGSDNARLSSVVERLANDSHVAISWSTGDLLIVDNRRALHARGPVTVPDPDRVLKRILVLDD